MWVESIRVPSTATYLSELNREQRQAVEHGIGAFDDQGPPLLVIAGAGLGQDQNSRASGRASYRQRRRSSSHSPPDVLASRIRGTRSARPAHFCTSIGNGLQVRDGSVDLDRDISWHWRPAVTRVCRSDRTRFLIHDPRPRGFRRPHELRAASVRPLKDRESVSE